MRDDIDFNDFLAGLLSTTHENENTKDQSFKSLFEERINTLGITQSRAEVILGIEKKTLNKILSSEAKRIDIITMIKLAQFLNLSVDGFIKFLLKELPTEQIGEIEKTKKAHYIIQNFDLSTLLKAKFIESKSDYSAIESKVLSFFGLSNLYEYSLGITPAFSKTKRNSGDLMREFWVRSAYTQFQLIGNDNDYNRENLKELIPKIRPYTRNVDKGLLTVIRALYAVGVTVIYQPYLPTVQVRGATFVIDGKPCIVLTDLNKRYPTIWFALMHELHHVLYDYDEIGKRTYHLTGDPDLWLMQEDKADVFSREYLFGIERSRYIEPFIHDPALVKKYAEKNHVHPSIIYSFYMYDHDQWGLFTKEIPDIKTAVRKLNINPWEKETINENVQVLKEQVFNI
jgi:HTH-type transcriptional regulator/antitoxin HigA